MMGLQVVSRVVLSGRERITFSRLAAPECHQQTERQTDGRCIAMAIQ